MFTKHEVFISPKDENQKIWRYVDFTKFVDLLNTSSLYFTRSDLFSDVFEGSVTSPTAIMRAAFMKNGMENGKLSSIYTPEFWHSFNEDNKKEKAINCWHMNDYESAAMWKLYLKSNEGIAIQSTYNKLVNSFSKSKIDIQVGTVKYIDYEKDFIPIDNGFSPFLHKRKSFEHEKELRCIVWQPSLNNKNLINLNSGGVKVEVDLHELVQNIYVSPDSPFWLTELIKDVTRKFGFDVPVVNSKLRDNPIY